MNAAAETTATHIHPFERAGLGAAPYRLDGYRESRLVVAPGEPSRPGASCDYCGTAIVDTFILLSADGRTFKVGSDCVHKTTSKGARILSDVERKVREIRNEKAQARLDAKASAASELLAREDVRATLAAEPHPLAWRAEKGATLLEWAEWMMQHAGRKGRAEVAAVVAARAA